jgi:hypothetical protein
MDHSAEYVLVGKSAARFLSYGFSKQKKNFFIPVMVNRKPEFQISFEKRFKTLKKNDFI